MPFDMYDLLTCLPIAMIWFDPLYFLFALPGLILAGWAQMRLSSTYATASRMPAPLSGAAAARHILDSAGLQNVGVEMIGGHLSDHYDPRDRVLRLSPPVYQGKSLAAVGIAAHEAGHALQHAHNYAPLAIRNMAVPAASFGSNFAVILIIVGAVVSFLQPLVLIGIGLFMCFVFFQVVNLPVEYNASSRAKAQIMQLGFVSPQDMTYVNKVLGAAALTYVAATLTAILQLLYLIMRFAGGSNR